jgi:antitoxin component of MazEF toxin-antitoxin module
VDIEDKGNEIIIKPKEKIGLSELLNAINAENIHAEIEADGPIHLAMK